MSRPFIEKRRSIIVFLFKAGFLGGNLNWGRRHYEHTSIHTNYPARQTNMRNEYEYEYVGTNWFRELLYTELSLSSITGARGGAGRSKAVQ